MTHTKTKIALVPGQYPSVMVITGLSFNLPIIVRGRELTQAQTDHRIADLEQLVSAWNSACEVTA